MRDCHTCYMQFRAKKYLKRLVDSSERRAICRGNSSKQICSFTTYRPDAGENPVPCTIRVFTKLRWFSGIKKPWWQSGKTDTKRFECNLLPRSSNWVMPKGYKCFIKRCRKVFMGNTLDCQEMVDSSSAAMRLIKLCRGSSTIEQRGCV